MKNPIQEETKKVKDIFRRFKRKDFSGNTGQAIKNSTYQLTATLIAKAGSLFFMIILARLLLPELYGIYGLLLSTILLFTAFSDLGIGPAVITFISKKLAIKDESYAKGYYLYLRKYKLILFLFAGSILALLSYPLATYYFKKPLFLSLLIGVLYLLANSFISFFTLVSHSKNDFKTPLKKEIIIQVLRVILVPLAIILFSKKLSTSNTMAMIFITLSLIYLLAAAFLFIKLNYSRKIKAKPLTKKDKSQIWKFILPLSATALSGTFFGSTDMFMLGGFVSDPVFIGYYYAAFGLIGAAAAILSFSSISLFPIFSRLKGKKLESGFRKSIRMTLVISIAATIFTYTFANILIKIPGPLFQEAIYILKLFSLLLISFPLTALYGTYYISQKKTKSYAILLFSSAVLNILLNLFLIPYGLKFGMMGAVYGACIATIISRYAYLGGLIIFKK